MTFPHPRHLPSAQRLDATASGIRDKRTRVLVVDNHPLVRRGLAALVNAEDDMVSCGEVACASSLLDELPAHPADVILMGVSASDATCLQLMQCIRKRDAEVRIIALAISDKPDVIERVLAAGATAAVMKNELATRILEVIRRGRNQPVGRRVLNPCAAGARDSAARLERGLEGVEREIIEMIGLGVPTREMAVRVGLSVSMVEGYRRRIRTKLNHPTPSQLVQFCVQWAQRAPSSAVLS